MSLLISGCHIGVRPIACWYTSMARSYNETFGKKPANGAPHRPHLRLEYVVVYL